LGYKIGQIWIDEEEVIGTDFDAIVDDGFYTFENVSAEHWLTVNFVFVSIEQYFINASVSTVGGTISPSGKITVQTGDEPVFTFTAQAGYQLSAVLVDNINLIDDAVEVSAGVYTYTFEPIVGGHTLVGKFEKKVLTIAASMGTAGGTVSPIGESTVTYGGSKAYTITAQTGYIIDKVMIDGVDNPAAATSGLTV